MSAGRAPQRFPRARRSVGDDALIEAVMYFALGFLSAGIVALVLGPPLWRRALRLTRQDMERTLPMTRAEIQAEKDQLRAGFALSISTLNQTIGRLKAQVTEQFIDINRKREVITHLTAQGSLSADDIVALETRRAELEARMAEADLALATTAAERATSEQSLATIRSNLAAAEDAIRDLASEREAQRLEIIARDTELDNLRDTLAAMKLTSTFSEVASADFESEMSALKANLAIQRRMSEEQSGRESETEATIRAAVAELKKREADLNDAHARIEDLSVRLVEAETAEMGAIAIREEKADLARQIAALQTMNARLEADIVALKQTQGGATAEETALLRGKLIEFGAAVARMAAERGNGPSLVTELPPPPEEPAPTGLADRIRALQHASGSL
jgi:chromosome segregation ATPase